jgi:hypothetical protein
MDINELAGLDAEALRQRYAQSILLEDKTEHIGRKNRVVGWQRDIIKRLITLGSDTDQELLLLLHHPSEIVRRSAAFDIRPFDRKLFISLIDDLARAGGAIGDQVRRDMEFIEMQEKLGSQPATPEPAPDPDWQRIVNWQKTNSPPAAMSQGQFKDWVSTEFSPQRARQLLALTRPAIGLWPQRQAPSASPLATRTDGQCWAPPDWQWPMCEEEPLYFLAQIYCPALAGLPGAELLPREGLLTFFGDFDAISGCFPPGEPEQSAVYHWPEESLVPAVPPLPLDMFPDDRAETAMVFRPFIDLPHPFAAIIKALRLDEGEKQRYWSLWDALRQHGVPKDALSYCDIQSKILGWPDLVQNDFHLPQAGASSYLQLVQLPARMGPGGSLYFFIRDADLAGRHFDRCIMEEQNT